MGTMTSRRWFRRSAQPTGVVTSDLSDAERETLTRKWLEKHSGPSTEQPRVLRARWDPWDSWMIWKRWIRG